MNLFKQFMDIFSGKPAMARMDDRGIYYYVRCKRCGEIIRVRIDPMNDMSWNDDNSALFVRKVMVGKRCYNRIEGEFEYDKNRKLTNSKIDGGDLVDVQAYETDQQEHAE